MAKQRLSERHERQLALQLRRPILAAYTRGGWPHHFAEVWLSETQSIKVDRRTGEVVMPPGGYVNDTVPAAPDGVFAKARAEYLAEKRRL